MRSEHLTIDYNCKWQPLVTFNAMPDCVTSSSETRVLVNQQETCSGTKTTENLKSLTDNLLLLLTAEWVRRNLSDKRAAAVGIIDRD